jgi:hypothetical protein
MNFGLIRVAFITMLRAEIPTSQVASMSPRAPENINPPTIWLGDGHAEVDLTMQQRIWNWTFPLNIAVANVRDYPREQEEAEALLAEIVPLIDDHYNLEADLDGSGIQIYGLEYTSVDEGGIQSANQTYAGITMHFAVKCKFPLTLTG